MRDPTPIRRNYALAYHPGDRCPGCGHSNWLVGRVTAQCGFCGTALVLASHPRAEMEAAA